MTSMALNNLFMFLALTGIYVPSAVQQHTATPRLFEGGDDFWKLDDLDGLALDRAAHLYALTSHSRDADGDEKKSRDKLVRFRLEGERVIEPVVAKGLKPALAAAHPVLARAADIRDA
jgi:hypothetical protein